MPRFVHNVSNLIRRVLFLARPYGRAKLAGVLSLALAQAVFQVIGATSIFPFLAIAVANCDQLVDLANEIPAVAAFHAN